MTMQKNTIAIIIRPVNVQGYKRGLYNGYITLALDHPWANMDAMCIPCECHGGVTYSAYEDGCWVIGFDTNHGNDSPESWPIERVARECELMMLQAYAADRETEALREERFWNEVMEEAQGVDLPY